MKLSIYLGDIADAPAEGGPGNRRVSGGLRERVVGVQLYM
jgi:hypothetical protein